MKTHHTFVKFQTMLNACKTIGLVSISCLLCFGCITPANSRNRKQSSTDNFNQTQRSTISHYETNRFHAKRFEPDFSDVRGTNFILHLADGFSVEMIWCPRGIMTIGKTIEEIVSEHPSWTYKEVNTSTETFFHEVSLPGFWISNYEFSASDLKRLLEPTTASLNDRFRVGNGLTWSEAMRLAGVCQAQLLKTQFLKFEKSQYWFRLPTLNELTFASHPTAMAMKYWNLEKSSNLLWCYDSFSVSPYHNKTVFSQIERDSPSSHWPTAERLTIREGSIDGKGTPASPYSTLSRCRLVLSPGWPEDPYMGMTRKDYVGICPDKYFFFDRALWVEQWSKQLMTSFNQDSSKKKEEVDAYLSWLRELLPYDANPPTEEQKQWILGGSIVLGDYVTFREIVNSGITRAPTVGCSPAMVLAAAAPTTNYLAHLFAHGGRVNVRDTDGSTPLHEAVQDRIIDNVKWLIEHGADQTAKDKDGYTPLAVAKERGFSEIVSLLSSSPTPSTVMEERVSSGTAWFINDSTIVTCHHVIEDCKEIWTETETGTRIDFAVLAEDPNNDIAILKAKSSISNHSSLPLSSKLGSIALKVFTVGYPLPDIMGSEKKYNDGTISALSGIGNDNRVYQISIPIQPGNSGGAVVSEDGLVIGLAAAALDAEKVFKLTGSIPQNVNYAIKSRYITALLQDNGIPYDETPPKSGTDTKAIVDQVSRATILLKAK